MSLSPSSRRREAVGGLGLRIGIAALLPRQGEALGVEPREQPHQQLVVGHAPLGDQHAVLKDLLDAAVDRAVEGDRRQPAGPPSCSAIRQPALNAGERTRSAWAERTESRAAAAARWTWPVSASTVRNSLWRSALQPASRLREDSRECRRTAVASTVAAASAPPPDSGWSPSPSRGGIGGSRSVGHATFCSGSGTSDRRGPPTSSAASATSSNFLVALRPIVEFLDGHVPRFSASARHEPEPLDVSRV